MAISLFPHNETAYLSALSMMEQTGKAAIIHPTGTGKSFIGFKLCEENGGERVCWLSPSEYIFKTQLENLKKAGGAELKNLRFYTYAKLMLMTDEELSALNPTYIVLDEFHRCGAEMWGEGVRRLLRIFSKAKVLGLSATAIRYLDNRRNMAAELFDGNVASEITLGEAIVRGILKPPKYVLSVYSCKNSLKKYEARVRRHKSKAVKDAAEEYFEKLRRALQNAEGINEIFKKHIEDKSGKYIVFCSNYEHLCEMTEKVRDWFGEIDDSPHVYKAYSDDPATDKAFASFKSDNSEHLKLLFCIDMLNEGVHVDDVSGVILLRPTVSPIIYKQQIGRALSASKKTNPVIFDIVLNIENLYSVGAIEDEMQVATAYYRARGEADKIAVDSFRVYDEVKECRLLFNRLNDALSASWEYMYAAAKRYYEAHGDLEVEKRYVTDEGYSLGSWIQTQRLVYAEKARGTLTNEQVKKLNAIGMRWESVKDIAWEKNYTVAKAYYAEHGHLLPSVSDKAYSGVKLGRWLAQLRNYKKSGICSAYLTDERIKSLDRIGMVWDVPDYLFEKNYSALLDYYKKHGNANVPSRYVTEEGLRLGAWVRNIRNIRSRNNCFAGGVELTEVASRAQKERQNSQKEQTSQGAQTSLPPLTPIQIERLNELGFCWKNQRNNTWNDAYAAACEYKAKHGDLKIPAAYVTEDGCNLGRWLRRQKDKFETLPQSKRAALSALGLEVNDKTDPWGEKFALLEEYFKEHGNLKIPANYVVNGVWLGRWLCEQRARLNGKVISKSGAPKKLTAEQERKLLSLGVQKKRA